jgi:iron(III) transport system permease protein
MEKEKDVDARVQPGHDGPVMASLRKISVLAADPLVPAMGMAVALATLVILALLGTVLFLGFVTSSVGDAALRFGLANYAEILGRPELPAIALNTLIFSAIALAVALAFGLPLAWLVERSDLGGKGFVLSAMLVSLLVPAFASAMGWLFLLHPRIGLVNVLAMRELGFADPPFNILSLAGMGWVQGLNLTPVTFLMLAGALRAMDPALEEAGLMSGAGPAALLRRVTLPVLRPALLSAMIYVWMIAVGTFDVPAIIGWGNRIFTFSTYIYLLSSPQDVLPRFGAAAALSSMMLALCLLLTWQYAALTRQAHRYAIITGKNYRPRRQALGAARHLAWAFIALYLALAVLAPILVLIWSSLLPFMQIPTAATMKLLSLQQYDNLPWPLIWLALKNSSLLLLGAPTLVLVLSFAFSWIGLRSRAPGRGALDSIAFLPHSVPSIVFGTGGLLAALFLLAKLVNLYGTLTLLLIVFAAVWISYGTRITNNGLLQIHRELEESARTSGATSFGVVRRVVLPLMRRSLAFAWLYLAILTLRELTIAVILTTPRNITLPVVVWTQWANGGLAKAAACAVLFLALAAPLIGVTVFAMQRAERS